MKSMENNLHRLETASSQKDFTIRGCSLAQARDCSLSRRTVLYETVNLHALGTAASPEELCCTRLFTSTG